MSKVIRVSNEVFDALIKNAKGFETPDKVLRRLMGLDKKKVLVLNKKK